MEEDSFGQFLHKKRMRVKGSDLARQAGISYVYLLDIERGARSVPSAKVLIALANNLPFNEGERRRYFDLAAKERDEIPADISEYIKTNRAIAELLRCLYDSEPPCEYLGGLNRRVVQELEVCKNGNE